MFCFLVVLGILVFIPVRLPVRVLPCFDPVFLNTSLNTDLEMSYYGLFLLFHEHHLQLILLELTLILELLLVQRYYKKPLINLELLDYLDFGKQHTRQEEIL